MSQLSLGRSRRHKHRSRSQTSETLRVTGHGDTRGRGQSDGDQPGDPPLHRVLGLPRVLGRPLDCAHHGHHIRVSNTLSSPLGSESGRDNAVLGVVNSDNNNQTWEPETRGRGKQPETVQSSCRLCFGYFLPSPLPRRLRAAMCTVRGDINNVEGHKDFFRHLS